jgi:3-methyladenine DNA glycosylase AlkD
MTAKEIVAELSKLGSETIKKVLMRHGAREPFFGVKIEDLKKIQKRIKQDHALALELYDTGIGDAMYLAGLLANPQQMKKTDLQRWLKKATWSMLSEYTVPWVAAESSHGVTLAREWIESPREEVAAAGWATYGSLVAITPDDELDLAEIGRLLDRVQAEIHTAPNRVRYLMNGFVIAVGSYVVPLASRAKAVAQAIGKVEVDMGETACKVPDALEYIAKVEQRGKQGTKRKTAFC